MVRVTPVRRSTLNRYGLGGLYDAGSCPVCGQTAMLPRYATRHPDAPCSYECWKQAAATGEARSALVSWLWCGVPAVAAWDGVLRCDVSPACASFEGWFRDGGGARGSSGSPTRLTLAKGLTPPVARRGALRIFGRGCQAGFSIWAGPGRRNPTGGRARSTSGRIARRIAGTRYPGPVWNDRPAVLLRLAADAAAVNRARGHAED